MSRKEHHFKAGDSVRVKPNVQDPDFGDEISGWVGRIIEIENESILIQWDSLTLASIPVSIINQCEQDGLDWSRMNLYLTEVRHIKPRDSLDDVERTLERLQSEHLWDGIGEEGSRIQKVLQNVDPDDEWCCI
ncbi:hypothetical protein [Desulfobacula sp.]|uniref:hypothetical protein n=1 Tax=Desulfobacula sp. TaxID=2593537 RepID=UPI0026073EC7|nr:hypothetical protein [Desulfobacula sp.]